MHEKIFAHTDKSFYIAGETIWLKTYVVYAASHQPADLSKVVYVELLDATSKPVLQTKLQAKSGHASGSLLLPAALPTGNYILRAYTMWMQNFDPQFFFAEKITVVNSFNRPDWPKLQADRKYSIELFPEGGHLVYGLENTVAFRIKNNDGSWLAANGFLLNRNNDTLANLESNTFGLGKFRFIPDESTSYKVIFPVGHNEILSQSIDSIDHKGYVMQLTRSGEDQLSVKVTTTNANVRESVYLLVHTRQRVKKVQASILENGSADFLINERELGEGVSHITVFNTERQPVCERIYFLHPSKAGIASISSNKNVYGLRDQVNLRLQLGVPAQPSGARLSMTVFRLDSLNRSASKNISTYLWLQSDLGNDGELYKDFVLDSHNDTVVDLLMMTSGWRRYKWADVLNNKTPVISFLPEYEGHLIRARISNMPGAERSVSGYLSIP
ncbi:MAG TPA: hypothetical protein VEZ55_10540, partial [Chitinophagaceae bacterium]|nr:hypothetical protein [Chitinophagaceae bacterium]